MEGLEVLNCMVRVDCWDSAVLWFSGVAVVRGWVWIGADVYWFRFWPVLSDLVQGCRAARRITTSRFIRSR